MAVKFKLVSGDTGSKLRYAPINDGDDSVIDLTGKTAKILWKKADGTLAEKDMTVTTITSGALFTKYGGIKVAEYQFTTTEIFSGVMDIEVKITDAGGGVIRSLELDSLKVRAALS